MKKLIATLLFLGLTSGVLADAPRFNETWQWNDNVKIDFIYGYESAIKIMHLLVG